MLFLFSVSIITGQIKLIKYVSIGIIIFSGLGYIIGGETAKATGAWQWGLRITPVLGLIAIILLITLVKEPIRGEREGGVHLTSTTWSNDIKTLLKK